MSLARLAAEVPLHPDTLAKYEKAERWPARSIVEILDRVLHARGVLLMNWQNADHGPAARTGRTDHATCGPDWKRRAILPAAAAALAGPSVARLLDAVVGVGRRSDDSTPPPTLGELERRVAAAKTRYQACQYDEALADLPTLLQSLAAATQADAPEDAARAHALAADTYHVTASILLKLGDQATALLAADRSSRHATASEDPVASGASARIMTHALASNGHSTPAMHLAQQAVIDLDAATRLATPDAVAVYGALALRGAVAAARSGVKESAEGLLEQAARAATRLGQEGNTRWTGFGPANVGLHRVNIALTFGDVGNAIRFARLVRQDRLLLAERKVSLFLDVAQAYTLWGRHDAALTALRTASRIAPQEVRSRPTVHRLVLDLCAHAPTSVRTRATEFASAAGIST